METSLGDSHCIGAEELETRDEWRCYVALCPDLSGSIVQLSLSSSYRGTEISYCQNYYNFDVTNCISSGDHLKAVIFTNTNEEAKPVTVAARS
jgi:hypothetical protein